MPRPATYLHLPQPCQQSWAAMTPTGVGRHCAACQQVVVDFTQKTDAELLAYFRQAAGGSTCGRFRAGQLGRPLVPALAPTRWRNWLGAVLALGGVLGGGRALAQTAVRGTAGPLATTGLAASAGAAASVAATPAASAGAPAPAGPGGPLVVRGKVVGKMDGQGLPGVTIVLQGTELGMSTTMEGEFELTLPESATGGTLLVSSIGYSSQHLPIAAGNAAPLVVQLEEDVTGLSGIVVAGGYSLRKPWPWHPRRLYQWGKYQLLRPFRP